MEAVSSILHKIFEKRAWKIETTSSFETLRSFPPNEKKQQDWACKGV
jgi:hypothetical protein